MMPRLKSTKCNMRSPSIGCPELAFPTPSWDEEAGGFGEVDKRSIIARPKELA
jgi:hypothetical protein